MVVSGFFNGPVASGNAVRLPCGCRQERAPCFPLKAQGSPSSDPNQAVGPPAEQLKPAIPMPTSVTKTDKRSPCPLQRSNLSRRVHHTTDTPPAHSKQPSHCKEILTFPRNGCVLSPLGTHTHTHGEKPTDFLFKNGKAAAPPRIAKPLRHTARLSLGTEVNWGRT